MGLGKLPGGTLIKVGNTAGPAAYNPGGFLVQIDLAEITKDEDILGVYTDSTQYGAAVSGYEGNSVRVLAYYAQAAARRFQEVSAGDDLSGVTFSAVAKQGGF